MGAEPVVWSVELAPASDNGADAFARLALELHDSGGVEETVQAVVDFALQALNCSHAGVALATRLAPVMPPAPLTFSTTTG